MTEADMNISEAKQALYVGMRDAPGVTGAGISSTADGTPAIVIYVETDHIGVPTRWHGFAVLRRVSGRITAQSQ
jgi:hypothetical protein